METSPAPPPTSSRRVLALRLLLLAAALAGLAVLGRLAGAELPRITEKIESLGALGPPAFVLTYALAAVLFAPGSALTLAAGAIFGLWRGALYSLLGATAGSCLAFALARSLARGIVERRIAGDEKFAAVDRAIAREGRKVVFLLRLSPAFPFNFLNYALGLTRVRFGDYLLASLGMIPGAFLYAYYGKLAGTVAAALAGGAAPEKGKEYYLVLGAGLVATVLVTALVARLAKKALEEAAGE